MCSQPADEPPQQRTRKLNVVRGSDQATLARSHRLRCRLKKATIVGMTKKVPTTRTTTHTHRLMLSPTKSCFGGGTLVSALRFRSSLARRSVSTSLLLRRTPTNVSIRCKCRDSICSSDSTMFGRWRSVDPGGRVISFSNSFSALSTTSRALSVPYVSLPDGIFANRSLLLAISSWAACFAASDASCACAPTMTRNPATRTAIR